MSYVFWTDDDRLQALSEAFALAQVELHPNVQEFYDRYVATLDNERAWFMTVLVNGAKNAAS